MNCFKNYIRTYIICLLVLANNSNVAAELNSDSLYRAYQFMKDDSTKVKLLRELGYNEERNDKDKAIKLYMEAIQLSQKIGDKTQEARCLITLGILYTDLSEYKSADSCLQISISIAKKEDLKPQMISALLSMGNVFFSKGAYDSGLPYYLSASKVAEEIKDYQSIAACYRNITNLYYALGDIPKAKFYSEKAAFNLRFINDERGLGRNYSILSHIYSETGEHDKSIESSLKAILYLRKVNDVSFLQSAYENIASEYFSIGNFKAARFYCDSSLSLAKKLGDANGLFHTLILKGRLEKEDKNYLPAEEMFNEALIYAKKEENLEFERVYFENMNSLYFAQNKFKEAYEYLEKFVTYNDSVNNEDKLAKIAEIESKYLAEKQEALASAEISKQKLFRNSIAGGTGVLLCSALVGFFLYKRRREADFKYEVSEVEMKALRAQMNPHFIFNSLNSIKNYLEKNDNERAGNYLIDFASLMRLILENSELKEVTLKDDLKALELYMKLESMRMTKKLDYKIKVDPDIDPENTLVPPLILQPFVENSIWHGLSKKEGDGMIKIFIRKNGEMLECIVEDNGIGREKSGAVKAVQSLTGKKSLGMKITRSRIDILNRVKKSNASVELIDLAEGLRVVVMLPLELDF